MICTCEMHTLPCSHELIQDVLPQDAIPASSHGWQTPTHGCSHGKERGPEVSSVRSNRVFERIYRSKRAHHGEDQGGTETVQIFYNYLLEQV